MPDDTVLLCARCHTAFQENDVVAQVTLDVDHAQRQHWVLCQYCAKVLPEMLDRGKDDAPLDWTAPRLCYGLSSRGTLDRIRMDNQLRVLSVDPLLREAVALLLRWFYLLDQTDAEVLPENVKRVVRELRGG